MWPIIADRRLTWLSVIAAIVAEASWEIRCDTVLAHVPVNGIEGHLPCNFTKALWELEGRGVERVYIRAQYEPSKACMASFLASIK
jgi:hypothetical protein